MCIKIGAFMGLFFIFFFCKNVEGECICGVVVGSVVDVVCDVVWGLCVLLNVCSCVFCCIDDDDDGFDFEFL